MKWRMCGDYKVVNVSLEDKVSDVGGEYIYIGSIKWEMSMENKMRINMKVKFMVVSSSDCSDLAMAGGFWRPPQ